MASLCALGGFIALCDAPAQAAVIHEFLPEPSKKISEGVPASSGAPLPGPISAASSMTVDSGKLYVAERIEATREFRLDAFDASSGTFVSQISHSSEAEEELETESGVAVGHLTGEAVTYAGAGETVAGQRETVVGVFGEAGGLLGIWRGADTPSGSFGFGGVRDVAADNSASLADSAAGDVYVADHVVDPETNKTLSAVVDVFKPEAGGNEKYVTQLTGTEPGVPFSGPQSVAVNQSSGDVLVVDGQSTVDIFTPAAFSGQYEFAGTLTGPGGSFTKITGVAVDGGNGDIYVTEGEGGPVDQFNAAGEFLGNLTGPPTEPFAGEQGLAIDPLSHHVYVGNRTVDPQTGETVFRVDVFGPNLVVPDVTTEPASSVQPASATLNGVVNPAGVQVSDCHFDYGATLSYGQSVPCAQTTTEIGAGSTPVPVSADLSGLTPGVIYHFRLSASNVNGANTGADRLFGPPRIDGESSANEAQTTATLQAQINPDAADTTCQFEYVDDAHYKASAPDPYSEGTTVQCSPPDIGSGTGDQAVSAELSVLQAGATYHWRVVAVNAAGTVAGADQTLSTVPPAQIDTVTISNVMAMSATVNAQINPLGQQLSDCHIDYGTDTSYGHSAICTPDAASIPADSADHSVHADITNLEPDITYHFRIVLVNPLGVVRSGDHTFRYDTAGGGLPDGRAYEMVTPPAKNAALIGDTFHGIIPDLSQDGSTAIISSIQCFAGAPSCNATHGNVGSPYAFTRNSSGWVTTPLAPSAAQFTAIAPFRFSADDGTTLFSMPTPPMGQDDFYARQPDGSLIDIGPITPPEGGATQINRLAANPMVATADLSHVVYELQTEASSKWSFDATTGGGFSLYEYAGSGNAPVLVGVSGPPGSHDLISRCHTHLGGDGDIAPRLYGSLSEDGRIVYFTAVRCESGSGANEGIAVPVDTLYARVNGAETVAISEPSPNDDCTEPACLANTGNGHEAQFGDANLQGSAADGSKAFFTDTQQLTDNASEDSQASDTAAGSETGCPSTVGANGCNLYLYDFANPVGHKLIDVSQGAKEHGGPRVQGVMAISADGSHVYFVAKGVLSAAASTQGETAQDGANNLYVFERDASHPNGQVAFIARLPASDREQWVAGIRYPNVTPDGRFLVFTSHGALTPDVTRPDGPQQVFRYDAQTGDLVRISIGERGFNDNGNAGADDASIVEAFRFFLHAGPARPDPTMSHDGAYVFFDSPAALTPQALDNVQIGTTGEEKPLYAQNVYEYHDGHVYLISDGRDTSTQGNVGSVELKGADASGANVFFTTADPLVPQDSDTQLDFYDARIGGGFPYTPPPPQCSGDNCRAPASQPPTDQTPGSSVFNGPGNLTAPLPAPAKSKAKPLTRAQKLARALTSCRKKYKKSRKKRATCKKQAEKKYGAKPRAKVRKATNDRRAK